MAVSIKISLYVEIFIVNVFDVALQKYIKRGLPDRAGLMSLIIGYDSRNVSCHW